MWAPCATTAHERYRGCADPSRLPEQAQDEPAAVQAMCPGRRVEGRLQAQVEGEARVVLP